MANRIAGITIEIGGDTTKLSTALRYTGFKHIIAVINKNRNMADVKSICLIDIE